MEASQATAAENRWNDILSKPEHVESIESVLNKLHVLDDWLTLGKIGHDAMTSLTIEKISAKLEQSADLLNILADPKLVPIADKLLSVSESLNRLLDRLAQMEKNGSLEKLLEAAEAFGIITDSMTETTIDHLTKKGVKWAETMEVMADPKMMEIIPNITDAAKKAAEQLQTEPQHTIGLVSLLRLWKDPDIQRTIQWMVLTLKNISKEKQT